jgi:hypothetical protein
VATQCKPLSLARSVTSSLSLPPPSFVILCVLSALYHSNSGDALTPPHRAGRKERWPQLRCPRPASASAFPRRLPSPFSPPACPTARSSACPVAHSFFHLLSRSLLLLELPSRASDLASLILAFLSLVLCVHSLPGSRPSAFPAAKSAVTVAALRSQPCVGRDISQASPRQFSSFSRAVLVEAESLALAGGALAGCLLACSPSPSSAPPLPEFALPRLSDGLCSGSCAAARLNSHSYWLTAILVHALQASKQQ